ncbi:MAG: flagellar motor protein MotB [Solirubrobacteraceae bacterium]
MKNLKTSLTALCVGLLITSCVPKKKFEETQAELTKTYSNLTMCNSELSATKEQLAAARATILGNKELGASNSENTASLKSALERCLANQNTGGQNISKLVDEIKSSNSYIKRLVAANSKNDSLNKALSDKLTRSLGSSGTEDIEIKVKKAAVFISLSDKMLYRSGDYNLNSSANAVLAKIAKIINDYSNYDVQVVGHTDTQDISTKAVKDNWELSTLRSLSVVRALQNDHGVSPARLLAAGHGQYVPKASNGNVEGRSINRRTEIIILPNLEEFMKLLDKNIQNSN